ncbi:hypothetical protein NLI96_g2636 [Meripilus lineatus]|uniref:Uncharacterized protein n=1 Tax=Meripilus lineatus TaxID=2056292 RepID=A0AAD5YLT8_9APHY|nr:hypothetical protein NLI96_g2636 [Physisporinus lineatus]
MPSIAHPRVHSWPGCCRPPAANEQKLIGVADWPAVSLVHHVPIPPDVKQALDDFTASRPTTNTGYISAALKGVPYSAPSPLPRRGTVTQASPNIFARSENTPSRTSPVSIPPSKTRSGGSPQQLHAALILKDSGDITSSSLPNTSAKDQYVLARRSIDTNDKRPDISPEARYSPSQRNADLGGTLTRKGSGPILPPGRRSSISAVAAPPIAVSKVTADAQAQRRRVISSASSDSSGSASETTLDGGFTDYLSDESEAELQRQAEIKAALIAHNFMEEEEFKAARRKLANVDLRPPQSWTGAVGRT